MSGFNVDIDSPAFQSKYDSGKALMETFGRGNMPRYQQPLLSERNNFEQSKYSRSKKSEYGKQESNKKILMPSRSKKVIQNKQNQYQLQKNIANRPNNHQFQQIDEISHKINNIIKSISNSTHKKQSQTATKSVKLQRSQTASKLTKLHKKYDDNHSHTHNKSPMNYKVRIMEQLKQQKGRTPLKERHSKQSQISKKFQQTLKDIRTIDSSWRDPPSRTERQFNHEEQKDVQYDDDINDRIQLLNDKISRYEQKMSGYQESYQLNKQRNEELFRQQRSKEKEDSKNIWKSKYFHDSQKSTQKSQINIKVTFAQSCQLQKKQHKEAPTGYLQSEKKLGYFTDKYKLLQQSKKVESVKPSKADSGRKVEDYVLKSPYEKTRNIEQSRKKYRQSHYHRVQASSKQSSDFFGAIRRQVALDQDFRYAKHMFAGIEELFGEPSTSSNERWSTLKRQLDREGYHFSLQEVQEIFMPRDDQIDPFMSVSHSHEELIHSVVFAYQTAEQHWKSNIFHSWALWQLKNANFTSESLDRARKGFINLQDLTIFASSKIDCQYRNRDLMLIFHRLGAKSKQKEGDYRLRFKEIMGVLLSA